MTEITGNALVLETLQNNLRHFEELSRNPEFGEVAVHLEEVVQTLQTAVEDVRAELAVAQDTDVATIV